MENLGLKKVKHIIDTIPKKIIKKYGIIIGQSWIAIRAKGFSTDIAYHREFKVINEKIYTEIRNKKISVWLYLDVNDISVFT